MIELLNVIDVLDGLQQVLKPPAPVAELLLIMVTLFSVRVPLPLLLIPPPDPALLPLMSTLVSVTVDATR